jgi:hypothetical protein
MLFACREPLYTTENGEDTRIWEPHHGPHELKFLKIGQKAIKTINDPFKKTVRFWDQLNIPDILTEQEVLFQHPTGNEETYSDGKGDSSYNQFGSHS